MKEGRTPVYPEETPWRRASENATYYSPKTRAPSETRIRAVALVVGWESGHANGYTTRRPKVSGMPLPRRAPYYKASEAVNIMEYQPNSGAGTARW